MNNAGRIGFVIKGNYDNSAKYDFLDVVFYDSASYVAKKVTIGNIPEKNNEYWQILAEGGTLTEEGDISNTTVKFEQEENRVNVSSGEKVSKIMGKVKKFFYDLKPVAFSGKYADIDGRITLTNSLLANQPGTALDAVQGKALDDKIASQNADFANSLAQINSDLSGFKYIYSTDTTKSVKELADNLSPHTLLIHQSWEALSDFPTSTGSTWILEIITGAYINYPRITLSDGRKMYLGFYVKGSTNTVKWRDLELVEVNN